MKKEVLNIYGKYKQGKASSIPWGLNILLELNSIFLLHDLGEQLGSESLIKPEKRMSMYGRDLLQGTNSFIQAMAWVHKIHKSYALVKIVSLVIYWRTP